MSKIVDIQLYRSYQRTGAIKVTGIRKVFTSMLIVLLIIAGGIGIYFYYSSQAQTAAVPVTPPKPKPKIYTLSQKVSDDLLRWAQFTKNVLDTAKIKPFPAQVLSDGDMFFLAEFALSGAADIDSIISVLGKAGRIITPLDTFHAGGKWHIVLRGRIPKATGRVQLMPVRKFLRTTVMNFVDSLARAHNLEVVSRENVSGTIKIKGGSVFKYRQVVRGSPRDFAAFTGKIKELKYAAAPTSFLYELDRNPPEYNIIWGLYEYQEKKAPSGTKQTAKK